MINKPKASASCLLVSVILLTACSDGSSSVYNTRHLSGSSLEQQAQLECIHNIADQNTGTSQGYLAKCPRSAKWHSDKTMERIYLKRPMFKK